MQFQDNTSTNNPALDEPVKPVEQPETVEMDDDSKKDNVS